MGHAPARRAIPRKSRHCGSFCPETCPILGLWRLKPPFGSKNAFKSGLLTEMKASSRFAIFWMRSDDRDTWTKS